MLLYDRSSAGFLRDEQLRYIEQSHTLTAEEWAKRGLTTKLLSEHLQSVDLQQFMRRKRHYPGLFPILHLDHIYYDGPLEVVHIEVLRNRLSLVASDHLPLVADVRI